MLDTPVVGKMLWARSATEAEARRFLRAMGGTISIYGHDVIPEGFEKVGDEQIVVSTSFGVFDTNKVYVSLDLAGEVPQRSTTCGSATRSCRCTRTRPLPVWAGGPGPR